MWRISDVLEDTHFAFQKHFDQTTQSGQARLGASCQFATTTDCTVWFGWIALYEVVCMGTEKRMQLTATQAGF